MRRRKTVGLLSLLVLAALACVVGWLTYQQERQERLNRALITAIQRGDVAPGLAALDAGADPNSKEDSSQSLSFWQSLRRLFTGMWSQGQPQSNVLTKRLIGRPGDTITVIGNDVFVNGKRIQKSAPQNLSALMLELDCEGEALEHVSMTPLSQALITKGANVNARDEYGDTPLVSAVGFEPASTIRALLDKGAEVNARNKIGDTALMGTAISDRADIVKILLAHGADVNIKNAYGETALSYAKTEGYPAIVHLLKQAGAKP
jgi:hypothetical protein